MSKTGGWPLTPDEEMVVNGVNVTATALAKTRQQIAHHGTGYVPAWDALTPDQQREGVLDAAGYLRALHTMASASTMTSQELWPEGRTLYYEAGDAAGFAATVKAEFGFDPSQDEGWGVWIDYGNDSPDGSAGFTSYAFHCPAEHLEALRDRWLLGS